MFHCFTLLFLSKERKLPGKNSGPKQIREIREEQLDNRRPERTKLIPQLLITGLSAQLKTVFRKEGY